MIIELTYNSEVQYIDTEAILYGYDDSRLNVVLNQLGIAYLPATTVFEANAIQEITTPSYSVFVTNTADAGFFEATHATLTTVCVNAKRINRLEVIDSSNTTIHFNYNQTLDVNESMSALITLINNAIAPVSGGGGLTQQQVEGLI